MYTRGESARKTATRWRRPGQSAVTAMAKRHIFRDARVLAICGMGAAC
jgi:hypothetical protein